jgi:hypothetical protein
MFFVALCPIGGSTECSVVWERGSFSVNRRRREKNMIGRYGNWMMITRFRHIFFYQKATAAVDDEYCCNIA